MSSMFSDLLLLANTADILWKVEHILKQSHEEGRLQPKDKERLANEMFDKFWDAEHGCSEQGATSSMTRWDFRLKRKHCEMETGVETDFLKRSKQSEPVKSMMVTNEASTSLSINSEKEARKQEQYERRKMRMTIMKRKEAAKTHLSNIVQEDAHNLFPLCQETPQYAEQQRGQKKKKISTGEKKRSQVIKQVVINPPEWLDHLLRNMGATGTELWVLQKTVTPSDADSGQNRLLLSPKIKTPVDISLNEQEKTRVEAEGIEMDLLDGEGRVYRIKFRFLSSNIGYRIIGKQWQDFVQNNALTPYEHTVYVSIFHAFPENKLCLAIVKADNPT